MALKQLLIGTKIRTKREKLTELRTKLENLKKREEDCETALTEAKTEEELAAVEKEADEIETEKTTLKEEEGTLEQEIEDLERELAEANAGEEAERSKSEVDKTSAEDKRGGKEGMRNYRFWNGMKRAEVSDLVKREDVVAFAQRTRELMQDTRSVKGAELEIPDVLLTIMRDNLHRYSKLIKRIYLKPVKGKARQTIAGTPLEAVWTEMIAKLNELKLEFNQIEVDGYKVGGYIPVPNSTLEDSDLALVSEVMDAISQGIGLAIDKAILYGKGVKMPVGILTRLCEAAAPAYWGKNEKAWTDLRSTHLCVIDPAANTDVLFFKDLILKCGRAKANYSNGDKFWALNSKTLATLQAKSLSFNAAGAIVSGQTGTMPVIGGEYEILEFIPDDVIIGGYGSLYLLAEREGVTLAQSEHVQFIEDNTVFKGTGRYDGRPVFGEGFVAINISQADGAVVPSSTAVTFAADTANV